MAAPRVPARRSHRRPTRWSSWRRRRPAGTPASRVRGSSCAARRRRAAGRHEPRAGRRRAGRATPMGGRRETGGRGVGDVEERRAGSRGLHGRAAGEHAGVMTDEEGPEVGRRSREVCPSVAQGAEGDAGAPAAASAGASTTATGRPARANTSAASSASSPLQSESGGRRRASSAEPATLAAICTAASASAAVVEQAGHDVLAGAREAVRQRAQYGQTGRTQRRAGEHGHLWQRVRKPDGVVEVGDRRLDGIAAGERAVPLGDAGRSRCGGAGPSHTKPAPSVTSCSGTRPARTKVDGADWAAASAAAPSAPRSSRAAACSRPTSSAPSTLRARRARVVRMGRASTGSAAALVGSVTVCSLLPRRARPEAGRGSSAPARTRRARRATPACAPPRAP